MCANSERVGNVLHVNVELMCWEKQTKIQYLRAQDVFSFLRRVLIMEDNTNDFTTVRTSSVVQSHTDWANKANHEWQIRAASDKEKVLLG